MKLVGSLALALLVLGIGYYVFVWGMNKQQEGEMVEVGATQAPVVTGTAIEMGRRYVDYGEEAFLAAADKQRVLFFHAPWCPTCRPVNTELEQHMSQIPEDVVVFKTDYDSETALKQKYGITYQHTFVEVDDGGNEVEKWNGGGLAQILARVE